MRFPMSLRSEEEFPMSLWGEGGVDVGSWWEVLGPEPGAVAWILRVRWEGPFVTRRRPRPASGAGVNPADGFVMLVDFGAEQAAPQAALRLRLQGGHLAWKKLISLVIGARIPAAGRHTRPRPLAAQTLHIRNHPACRLIGCLMTGSAHRTDHR